MSLIIEHKFNNMMHLILKKVKNNGITVNTPSDVIFYLPVESIAVLIVVV
jgi:hypothetical protein